MKNIFRSLTALVVIASAQLGHGGSATWLANPLNDDWNALANWTPGGPPNGYVEIATFDTSDITDITVSSTLQLGGMSFTENADAFKFTILPGFGRTFDVYTPGIVNRSVNNQVIVNQVGFQFRYSGRVTGGVVLRNLGGTPENPSSYGDTVFNDESSAGDGVFIAEGGKTPDSYGGSIAFFGESTADKSVLIATSLPGAGRSAAGSIQFSNTATGDKAEVRLYGAGNLFLTYHDAPGVTIGSLTGDGAVYLGLKGLVVGSNDLSTRFSGTIQEEGSLTKIGSGTLILSGANTYTGGTTIITGRLEVENISGSGLGTGPVQVNSGRLAGSGTIAGAVTLGTNSYPPAVLAPGGSSVSTRLGRLTIQSAITFESDGIYECELNSFDPSADQIVANGVAIGDGAQIALRDRATFNLRPGRVFVVISNTAATPIGGTFSNLADGDTVIIGSNTFQANYEGGDGNDLTLTVVQ